MIEDTLKNNKIKVTNQRLQILSFIQDKDECTIKDIVANCKNINQSTIYRVLILFEDKNIVFKMVRNHEIYYRFNKKDHKHYIECISCHEREILEECPYNNVDLKGYKIKIDEPIKGVCKKCQVSERIGIFVGSFNPPTNAHLEIGNLLLDKNIVDNIIYVPCSNLNKDDLINLKHRYKMLDKMISNDSMLVDDIKLKDKYQDFNYLDLDKLKEKYYGDFYIIIGSDNLLNLHQWANYEYLLHNYHFIVINRLKTDDLEIIENKYKDYRSKFIIVDYNNDISSTFIRKMIKNHENVANVLDKDVLLYIKNNHLYK